MKTPDRHIPFRNTSNFRDLGGYSTPGGKTVRWRKLFRSAALNQMDDRDINFLTGELNVSAVFDLRTAAEIATYGSGKFPLESVGYYNVPLIDDLEAPHEAAGGQYTLDDLYMKMITESGGLIAEAVSEIVRLEGEPILFHCAAGKDRTGVLAAVLLGLMDVERGQIVSDYTLSDRYLPDILKQLKIDPNKRKGPVKGDSLSSVPGRISSILDYVEGNFGSMKEYVLAHGMQERDIEKFKILFLE